jgi:hypothetical protein
MYKYVLIIFYVLFAYNSSQAQTLKLSCTEKKQKTGYGTDPIIIKTCFLKKFKFISTSYPDYAGRYVSNETEVFVRNNKKYTKTKNSEVFNETQMELLALINDRIQMDFAAFKGDSNLKECLFFIDSIPKYQMNDLTISFYKDEIWFEVNWGLPGACRNVDGTIVTFKLNELSKYFR